MAALVTVLYTLFLSIRTVMSAVPVSNCETTPCKYNMIDTNPLCYNEDPAKRLCPVVMKPGAIYGTFPNSEERFQAQTKNMFRMHPNESLLLPLGRLEFGTWGPATHYDATVPVCGSTSLTRKPMYWYTDVNQMARFKQWDEWQCDRCFGMGNGTKGYCWPWHPDYKADRDMCFPGPSGHNGCGGGDPHATCYWNDPTKVEAGSNCEIYFGDTGTREFCGADRRSELYGTEDSVLIKYEGICGGNSCWYDGHCEPPFLNAIDVIGTGFYPGMNGVANEYARNLNPEITYKLPGGAHYDERITTPEVDRTSGKPFGLLLEYFDESKSEKPTACYALYDSTYTSMDVYVSDDFTPDHNTLDAYSLFFMHLFPEVTQCEPYSFLCKTTSNNYYRLPEDERYYFGTEWLDWAWSNYSEWGIGYTCKENHYFNDGNDWIVDGGPTLTTDDIWYYQDTINYGECLGCNHIDVLVCWEACIKSNFDTTTCSACQTGTPNPTTQPTPKPTDQPVQPQPTNYPTKQPSDQPTDQPTNHPTDKPTKTPTDQPTDNPTKHPSDQPTDQPTDHPTDKSTKNPTDQPTDNPTKQPSHQPTDNPTDQPTKNPTKQPTSNPTDNPTQQPTLNPTTQQPTNNPITPGSPTSSPTTEPTDNPTNVPTKQPTDRPTEPPTDQPTKNPTTEPSDNPTNDPTKPPTAQPTFQPTQNPITPGSPTSSPTVQPTTQPTKQPTNNPTEPTSQPTKQPTNNPTSLQPTSKPTEKGVTCDLIREWWHRWTGQKNFREPSSRADSMRDVAIDEFVADETNDDCVVIFDSNQNCLSEYLYNWEITKWEGVRGKNVTINIVMCCGGDDKTFGGYDGSYNNENYYANSAVLNRYGVTNAPLDKEKDKWIGADIGLKQIIVYCIISVLLAFCCIFIAVFYMKKQKKKEKDPKDSHTFHPKQSDHVTKAIQMSNPITSYNKQQNYSTDGSTDENSHDNSVNKFLNTTSIRQHIATNSKSFDTPTTMNAISGIQRDSSSDLDDVDEPPKFSDLVVATMGGTGLPPPFIPDNINDDAVVIYHD